MKNRSYRRDRIFHLRLEKLESRATPATFSVTNLLDDGSVGSLRWAIDQANGNFGPDFIDTQPDLIGTIYLNGTQLPNISDDLTIIGPGASYLGINGADRSRILSIHDRATVTISGLTLSHGNSHDFGAGGGIFSDGAFTLTNCVISDCYGQSGGAIASGPMGTNKVLRIINSAIINNTAVAGSGGGVSLSIGEFSAVNSTFANNRSTGTGGAISAYNASMTLRNCTIAGNQSDTDGIDASPGYIDGGGGISSHPGNHPVFYNTIVARNTRGNGRIPDDLQTTLEIASANNLVSDADTSGGLLNGVNNNLVGVDPFLGALSYFASRTPTLPLLSGSPAIDAGSSAAAADLPTDQRGEGFARSRFAAPDIGAFEMQISAPTDRDQEANVVAEGASNGTLVGLTANSPDTSLNVLPVTYQLLNDDGGRFFIDSFTGVVTVANSSLINFESGSKRQITVQASDNRGSSRSTSFSIFVQNEKPTRPTDVNPDANDVLEGSARGTVVGITAQATDVNGGLVTYRLVDNASGRFAIHSRTGVVSVANGGYLDADKNSKHLITVLASDGNRTSTAKFTINVRTRYAVAVTPVQGVASLFFLDTARVNNRTTLSLSDDGASVVITDPTFVMNAKAGTVSDQGHTVTVPRSLFPEGRIFINTSDGDDRVTLDWTKGVVTATASSGIVVDTGAGADSLAIVGDAVSHVRYITGRLKSQPTSASLIRVSGGGANTHSLANLESIELSQLATLDFITRNGADDVVYSGPTTSKAKISGTSGGAAFMPVTWSNISNHFFYASTGDTADTHNSVVIQPGVLREAGVQTFAYSGGAGVDRLAISNADLGPSSAGGRILFNGNAGESDILAVYGDAEFTVGDSRISTSTGGGIRHVNAERVSVRGGNGANVIDARAFTKAFAADGGAGDDTILGGRGLNILIGGDGVDSLIAGSAGDVLFRGELGADTFGQAAHELTDPWFWYDPAPKDQGLADRIGRKAK